MKRAVILIVGMLAVLLTSSTAFAEYGDGGPPVIATNTSAPVAGGSMTLTIGNFHPNTAVTFSIGDASGSTTNGGASGFRSVRTNIMRPQAIEALLGTVNSDAVGSATIQAAAPATAGNYTVTAVDALGLTASLVITVDVDPNAGAAPATPTAPGGALPATGSSGAEQTLRIGGVAVILGLGLFGGAKLRRRSRLHTAS